MKYKSFPAPFFNHFIQPSPPPIAKLKSLHGVSSGQRPHKNSPIPLWVAPHMVTEISPPPKPISSSKTQKGHFTLTVCKRKVAATSLFFLLVHMLKSFVY